MVRRLSREEARRIAIRAQLLDGDRPRDLVPMTQRLTFLQLDPTAAVAPSADLMAWSRLGRSYRPAHLQQAIERDRTLFEHLSPLAVVRPMADLGLHLADMAVWPPDPTRRQWLEANGAFRRRVLEQLRASGPLVSRDIPDTCEQPWASTGWTNDRNVIQLLQFLARRGEVAVAGRRGRQRLWDLAERVYPRDVVAVPRAEAHRRRNEMWLRSLGVARPEIVGDAGVPVEIDGVDGLWRLDPHASAEGFRGRTALLSPFDRLVHDRVRLRELFDFEYALEMYKPKERRRWGYFALPVLHRDRLIGKVDATADRAGSRLLVHAVHRDVPFTRPMTAAVDGELERLARWLGLDEVRAGERRDGGPGRRSGAGRRSLMA